MPTCQHCGHKWSWKETFLKMFMFKNKIRCSSCDSLQYISKKSRSKFSLVALTPCFISVPVVSFGVPIGYTLAIELVAFALALIWMPFLCELSNQDEPMW